MIAACTSCSAMSRLMSRPNRKVMTDAPAELCDIILAQARHLAELKLERRCHRRSHHPRASRLDRRSGPGWSDSRPSGRAESGKKRKAMMPTSRIAINTRLVATGRSMKMWTGLTAPPRRRARQHHCSAPCGGAPAGFAPSAVGVDGAAFWPVGAAPGAAGLAGAGVVGTEAAGAVEEAAPEAGEPSPALGWPPRRR